MLCLCCQIQDGLETSIKDAVEIYEENSDVLSSKSLDALQIDVR